MNELLFNPDEVRKIVEHAEKSKKWRAHWDNDNVTEPHVSFVHDQGVYLMSDGVPCLQRPDAEKGHSFVTYAEGCHPEKDADWWDTSRAMVGGDDFAEHLPTKLFTGVLANKNLHSVAIRASEDSLDITGYVNVPAKKPAKKKAKKTSTKSTAPSAGFEW